MSNYTSLQAKRTNTCKITHLKNIQKSHMLFRSCRCFAFFLATKWCVQASTGSHQHISRESSSAPFLGAPGVAWGTLHLECLQRGAKQHASNKVHTHAKTFPKKTRHICYWDLTDFVHFTSLQNDALKQPQAHISTYHVNQALPLSC